MNSVNDLERRTRKGLRIRMLDIGFVWYLFAIELLYTSSVFAKLASLFDL